LCSEQLGNQRASGCAVGREEFLSQSLRIDHHLPLNHTEGPTESFNNGTGFDGEIGPPPKRSVWRRVK
jgi:hypothetical protein